MAIRRILVALGGLDEDAVSLQSALALARRFNAHVGALHAKAAAAEEIGLGRETAYAVLATERAVNERAARAREMFHAACKAHRVPVSSRPRGSGVSACFVERSGLEEDLVAECGRLYDLIVMANPASFGAGGPTLSIEAALRDTGRLVLITPRPLSDKAEKIAAVAWNGSIAAARAVAGALPLLRLARRTVVLTAGRAGAFRPPASEVVEYLSWHGIKAESVTIPLRRRSEGQALLHAVRQHGAGFLVQGAYTRGRLRRLVFGGVTGDMLSQTAVPLVMAH